MKSILAAILLILAAAPLSAQPTVGDIYDADPGSSFKGWQYEIWGGGSRDGPPYAAFRLGNDHLIAAIEEVAPARPGRRAVYRIVRTLMVRAGPGEDVFDGTGCSFINTAPALAFYSPSTRIARGAFVLHGEIRMMRWFVDEPELCAEMGD